MSSPAPPSVHDSRRRRLAEQGDLATLMDLTFRGPPWLIGRFTDAQTKRIMRRVLKAPCEEVIEGVRWRFTRHDAFVDIEQVTRNGDAEVGASDDAMQTVQQLMQGILQIFSALLGELERLRADNAHLRNIIADSERPVEGHEPDGKYM